MEEDSQSHAKTSILNTLVNTAHLLVCLFTTSNSHSPAKACVSGPRKRNSDYNTTNTKKKKKKNQTRCAFRTVYLRSQIRNFDFSTAISDSG